MFSIDISYPIPKENTHDLDTEVKGILSKYPNCKLYASDVGPYGKKYSQRYMNHGCFVTDENELKSLIAEIKSHEILFVSFVNYYREDDDNDPARIYTSPTEYRYFSPKTRRRYDDSVQELDGIEKEIYDILSN